MFRLLLYTATCHFIIIEKASFLLFLIIITLQSEHTLAQWSSYEAVSRRLSDRCDTGEFDCALGDTCIPLSKFRDGIIDCLDGSDEFCYPGQVKCGSYCVELRHLGECLVNPRCENITILPSYCSYLKTKLCHFEDALPCKGYNECVLRKWLMDGKKDCYDGSDEDNDYVRLLTSCLYPPKNPSNFPNNGFIPQIGDSNFPHFSPPPPILFPQPRPPSLPDNQYPGGGGSYATTTPPQSPWKPPLEPEGSNQPSEIGNELVPINPFVRVPTTTKPPKINPIQTTPITTESSFGGDGYNFGQNGVESGGGTYGPTMTPIVPVNKYTQPPYPFDGISGTSGAGKGEEYAATKIPHEEGGWVDVIVTKIPFHPGTQKPPKTPSIPTQYPPWNPHQIINPDIIISGHPQPTTHSTRKTSSSWALGQTSTPSSQGHEISTGKEKETISPDDEWLIAPIGGIQQLTTTITTLPSTTSTHPPHIPHPTHRPTNWQTPRTRPLTTTTSTTTTTQPPATIPVIASQTISDPYMFPQGIDSRLTTSAPPKTANCTDKIKKAASELVPNPMCDCPAGQMRNKDGNCVKAEISTFRARLMHLCGVGVRDNAVDNEAQILTWKLATAFDYPICVRKADDIIIFNTVCNGCEFSDLIDRYAMNNDLADIDVKLSELQKSGCYQFVINDCDEKAECIPDGLRYKCKCLSGTTDSDGTGRFCEGVVIANECVKFLGLCVLFWVLLLLLLAILLPIIGYLLWRYCKKRNYKVFDRFTTKKKTKTEITQALPPKQTNIEVGPEPTVTTTQVIGGQWESYSHPNIPTITTTSATTPRSTPLNQLLPADEYSIIENEDEEDKGSSKGDNGSQSSESTTALPKPVVETRVATPDRRSSSGSRTATPTIWETYKILGQQYTRVDPERRKSSTHSLELLIRKRQEEELKKRATAISLPDGDMEAARAKPPLPTKRGSITSQKSAQAEQASKLAAMLGVDTPIPIKEVENVSIMPVPGEPSTAEVASITENLQRQASIIPEINLGSIPSTPEIIKAAENAVTDALKNVMGPLYDPQAAETTVTVTPTAITVEATEPVKLTIDERLQTTTKASPTGSREDLPIIASESPIRPGSSISTRSALPQPTIEIPDISEELDKVAEALAQLPALPLPAISKGEKKKKVSKTQPSTARGSKTSFDLVPKTARSLKEDKLPKIVDSPSGSPKKTISSSLKEKPPIKPKRVKTSGSLISDEVPSSPKPLKEPKSAVSSPVTPKKAAIKSRPLEPSSSVLKGTTITSDAIKRKLPPLPRQPSSTLLKPKRVSSNPSTRQLSNISEKSESVTSSKIPSKDLKKVKPKLPHSISLPNTARSSQSKLPILVDVKRAGESSRQYDEPNYILADLDLDLPGPYMVPGSLEDLRSIGLGTSKLPHLASTQSAPSTDRRGQGAERLSRQTFVKSDEFWKFKKLPPIDVDLDDINVPDFDLNTSSTERPVRPIKATIARKIASRKAAGQAYPIQKDEKEEDIDLVYEYRRPKSHHSHVHDGCLQNQPPWDSSPLREGELDQVPIDWNLSRSSSLMSFTDRKTQSFTDLHKITAVQVTTTKAKVTTTNLDRNKSQSGSSLTNIFHFKAKIKNNDVDWVDDIKKSLTQTNSWLDYD